MGLFASRPEEPTDWAGLPGEPLRRDPADALPADGAADASPAGLLGLTGTPATSIAIPLTDAAADAPGADARPDADPDGDVPKA